MLKKRLIPKLLIKTIVINNKKKLALVTTKKFKEFSIIGDAVSQSKIYQSQKSDELIILFIDKNLNLSEKIYIEFINNFAKETFMPITIGGGVKLIKNFDFLLSNGADKISVNSCLFSNPNLVKKAVLRFGSQCIIASLDFIENSQGVFIFNRSKNKFFNINPTSFIKRIEDLGVGEILLTDINRDGMGKGINIKIAEIFSTISSVPIIISGGCSLASHFSECFMESKVSAISASTFFSFKDQNILQTRAQIKNAGVNLR
jgi:cyclase